MCESIIICFVNTQNDDNNDDDDDQEDTESNDSCSMMGGDSIN